MRPGVPDELLLVCSSYESRSVTIAECLAKDYRATKGVVYVNKEFLESGVAPAMNENLDKLKKLLAPHCDELVVAQGSWLQPNVQLNSLKHELLTNGAGSKNRCITVDITTFNREALLVAIALLRDDIRNSRIRTLYVKPQGMGPWLSRGFRYMRNVMGFSGVQDPSRPTVLVVLSGFEPERTNKIIEMHEPARVLLGIGDPPTDEKFRQRNLDAQKLVRARQHTNEFVFPANDTEACSKALEKLVGPLIEHNNVVLAPMSTKLSTLATYLFAERHPEVQITYCVPGEYNISDYSHGSEQIFVGELPPKLKVG